MLKLLPANVLTNRSNFFEFCSKRKIVTRIAGEGGSEKGIGVRDTEKVQEAVLSSHVQRVEPRQPHRVEIRQITFAHHVSDEPLLVEKQTKKPEETRREIVPRPPKDETARRALVHVDLAHRQPCEYNLQRRLVINNSRIPRDWSSKLKL